MNPFVQPGIKVFNSKRVALKKGAAWELSTTILNSQLAESSSEIKFNQAILHCSSTKQKKLIAEKIFVKSWY